MPDLPTAPSPAVPAPSTDVDLSLAVAVAEAARLADELAALHRRLALATDGRPRARAARFRLQDAAFTCRRAAQELAEAGRTRR